MSDETPTITLSQVTLFLSGEGISYETLEEIVDRDLIRQLKDIKIKKKKQQIHLIDESLQEAGMDLQRSIADRKHIIK